MTTAAGCAWDSASDAAWITITSGATGTGSGTVAFNVAPNSGATRVGTLTIAGQTFTLTQAGACAASINPTSQSLPATAGAGTSIAVTTAVSCVWTATSHAPWLSITSGVIGTGPGAVTFAVTGNPGSARIGTLTIAGQTFTVTQAGSCTASISPTSQSLPATAGAGTPIAVTTAPGCAWTAASQASWISITSGVTGTGTGTVSFAVTANPGSARVGTLTIAGQTFTVTQAGACTASISPTSQSLPATAGAGIPIAVTTAAGCAWTAASQASWISITSDVTGTGNGTVTFAVTANPGGARAGTLTIAGQTFTVTQGGSCAASINPTSQSLPPAGGAGIPIAVTTAPGCEWTATSQASWLTITSDARSSGSGTVNFTAAPNAGSVRTGTLTIATQTFTVTQAGSCTATIDPTSQSFTRDEATGSITVTIAPGCSWTATTEEPWITITEGATGTGPGTVVFKVDRLKGGPTRTGTILVAGRPFTVTQSHE